MKKNLIRIILSLFLFVTAILIKTDVEWVKLVLFIISYLIVGLDVVLEAVKNIFHGKVFDENFLMGLATVGAFAIGEYPEAVAVMLFYQVGELFQNYAVNKSRKSIASLMDIRPDYANVKIGDTEEKKNPDDVKIDDVIIIRPGERIPLDCVVISGSSMIDTAALTGESLPREINEGEDLLSGCININGVIEAKVTKEYGESTVSKILDLVENASSKKSQSENFITKFAAVYTPIVVISAVLLAVIPPLVFHDEWSKWFYRALTFLVVSCPCALVISVPLSFFGGIGGASKAGVLIKGSNYLEALAKAEIVVFDKTGTLTKGVFDVQKINTVGKISEDELLMLTAYAESYSNHPISKSLIRAYGKEIDNNLISNVEEISGHGVSAIIDGKRVFAGNAKLMKKIRIDYAEDEFIGTIVHVVVDGIYSGYIVIADKIKDDSKRSINELKNLHIKQTVMLTGDSKTAGESVGKELGMDKVFTELLPVDKVEKVEELFKQKSEKGKLAFVGDGINDAPVLARADIGIAMGGLGSDAAIEAADVVIMTDEPSKISQAIKISQKTLGIVNQNIIFALAVKISVLVLSSFGYADMWLAVFADVGVSVIAVVNALRALSVKK